MIEDSNKEYWVKVIRPSLVVAVIVVTILLYFSGCRSGKIQGYTKDLFDSLYAVELEEKIKVLEIENGELTARVNELEFLGVEFDNNCDSILKSALIKAGCNTDSIGAILMQYKSRIKTYADGSVEAEGFIKTLKKTKEKNEELISKYQKEVDSLKAIKQKEVHWKQVVTVTKTKTVKRGVYWWVWFLAGYGLCIILPPKRILSYVKIGISKILFKV